MRVGLSRARTFRPGPELVTDNWEATGDWSDMTLTNTDTPRATARLKLDLVPGKLYQISATLLEGSGSVHVGKGRELVTTRPLVVGRRVSRKFRPIDSVAFVSLVTESTAEGDLSRWAISVR